MTQKDKQLLLKDLCARLPYGVMCDRLGHPKKLLGVHPNKKYPLEFDRGEYMPAEYMVEDVKPYLRPMSSMTEDELKEFAKLKFKNDDIWEIVEFPEMKFGFREFINVQCRNKNNGDTWIYQVNTRMPLKTYWGIDWLNEHHFDFRDLIEMGLALEAPKGMYKTE